MNWIILVIIFFYGIPLWHWRYQFRSAVYKDKSWKINFRPWFAWEIHALFSDRYFNTTKEKAIARKYRWYLLGFALLWALFFSL